MDGKGTLWGCSAVQSSCGLILLGILEVGAVLLPVLWMAEPYCFLLYSQQPKRPGTVNRPGPLNYELRVTHYGARFSSVTLPLSLVPRKPPKPAF